MDFNKTGQAQAGYLCSVLSGHNVPRRFLAQCRANMGCSLSELNASNCMVEVQRGLKIFSELLEDGQAY